MRIKVSALHGKEIHDFLADVLVPRPIAFISTINSEGRHNAAPFSAFTHLTLDPPVLVIAAGRRKGQKKDTVRNIEAVGDFVVNMVDENTAQAMAQASADFPPEVDEIQKVGLTALKSDMVKSPRIAEAPISMECKLIQTMEFGSKPNRNTIILGEILVAHIKDEVMTDGHLDPWKARIVGRLGVNDGNLYCYTTKIFKMKRLGKLRPPLIPL